MKQHLRKTLLIIVVSALTTNLYAQNFVKWGISIIDTARFDFSHLDSFTYHLTGARTVSIDTSVIDSNANRLWQIGNTSKYFFADSTIAQGIMTDTMNAYPLNANNAFTLHLKGPWFNRIIGFTHKYETTPGLDGGIIEFSLDNGTTWQNALGQCNGDTNSTGSGAVYTDTFYTAADTLFTGEPGFSGTSNGWITSWLQFFDSYPERTTGGGCEFQNSSEIMVRFRFISDSVAESLDGWLIGSIKIFQNFYGYKVSTVHKSALSVYPNPSGDNTFNFPAIMNEQDYTIEIMNAIGQSVMKIPYTHRLSLANNAKGLYFYKVTHGSERYSGQLVAE